MLLLLLLLIIIIMVCMCMQYKTHVCVVIMKATPPNYNVLVIIIIKLNYTMTLSSQPLLTTLPNLNSLIDTTSHYKWCGLVEIYTPPAQQHLVTMKLFQLMPNLPIHVAKCECTSNVLAQRVFL